jgi:hypothetical protein
MRWLSMRCPILLVAPVRQSRNNARKEMTTMLNTNIPKEKNNRLVIVAMGNLIQQLRRKVSR